MTIRINYARRGRWRLTMGRRTRLCRRIRLKVFAATRETRDVVWGRRGWVEAIGVVEWHGSTAIIRAPKR